ncbi:alanine racemase [Eremococcus coleocola]|uniref:alanine racemase n=1 Tax=Eremococcus coleocola TaxID=88132 RepID=UPI000426F22B|nr:alanine racemase [Eremococcus coleocola]
MAYPKLVINKQKLFKNARHVLETCKQEGIEVVGVVKGINALDGILETLIDVGFKTLASSRIPQLKRIKEINKDILTYDLRIPMLSEVPDVVKWADISLNSSIEVLRALNEEAKKQEKIHKVIIMTECGDLREGIFNQEELLATVDEVEHRLDHLYLMGIGTNLGCYGSIMPTPEKMKELLEKADLVSQTIGRKIEVVSGAASTAFPLVARATMPAGITQMRIGDSLYISDLDECFNYVMFPDSDEAFTLHAEIIELKDKPSYPIGVIAVDAFGNKKEYENKGIRTRALIAVGRQDLGECLHLKPLDSQIEILGGSSDHTILDLTLCDRQYKLGDIVTFHIMYENMLMLTQSAYVEKEYI